ncbi:uncharacterized protein BJ171DRAFT_504736 [Polychytrium aggregatum]|uniref:uncharacterized protein n=1 Tax=Polychytrium aggregatum TaxID=110093 RepID=UPI0022FE0550|nr:uncharacterized protein BJ171DRAFT_504736 [Polychytrium aggregatum]KAI9204579.1 hypothetical protein BJ171DRAFT_504736 [Polychytrium aggregatum]
MWQSSLALLLASGSSSWLLARGSWLAEGMPSGSPRCFRQPLCDMSRTASPLGFFSQTLRPPGLVGLVLVSGQSPLFPSLGRHLQHPQPASERVFRATPLQEHPA